MSRLRQAILFALGLSTALLSPNAPLVAQQLPHFEHAGILAPGTVVRDNCCAAVRCRVTFNRSK
ncbi:MAG: hypothetical protein QM811_27045 [Pirellulales bacterium]